MPRDFDQRPCSLDVAVIGTGIAGLSAAWLCSKAHRVSVYERDDRIGGHSHTVEVPGVGDPVRVDTGFIVYNELNYPNLTALFAHLDVETRSSDMSFAASLGGGDLEYSGSSLAGLIAQPRNLLRPRFWRMIRDVLRFYRHGPGLAAETGDTLISLGDYLERERYSDAFIRDHLLPMAAAIWSAEMTTMRDHPAPAFVRFCLNHGLMRLTGRPRWRTVVGGSRAYVQRLTASFSDRIMTNARVTHVRRTPADVLVTDMNGATNRFDRVVIAAHADQALAMLDDPSDDERALLGAFRYSRNRAFLHQDPRLMPKRKRVWSSWNYIGEMRKEGSPGPLAGGGVCVTYWMNRLQGLDSRVPLFVTLNPAQPPSPARTQRSFVYEHPMYDLTAMRAQKHLQQLQGQRNTWYCGSYFGAGFHEDALSAGLSAGEAISGVRRPWSTAERKPEMAAEDAHDGGT